MAKSLLICSSFLLTCLSLVLHTQTGDSAPTHHLSIGVEGDTPKLFVTSKEIGSAPKILYAATVAAAQQPPMKDFKNGEQKPKGKSTKSQYAKKQRLQTYLAKEQTVKREKTTLMTTEAPETTTDANKETTNTATNLLDEGLTQTATSSSSSRPQSTAAVAVTDPESNQYETTVGVALPTTAAATTLADATSAVSNSAEQQKGSSSMVEPAETETTQSVGNLPRETQTQPMSITQTPQSAAPTRATTSSNVQQLEETVQSVAIVLPTEAAEPTTLTEDNMKASPTAVSKYFSETEKTEESTTAATSASTVTTETSTPAATTTVTVITKAGTSIYGVDNDHIVTQQAATHELAATPGVNGIHRAEQEETTAQIATAASNSCVNAVAKPTATVETSTTPQPAPSTSSPTLTTATTVVTEQEQQQQEADGIIKLIDLEKHDFAKIDEAKQHKQQRPHDDGHDGIKKTKKKQLNVEEHFLIDTLVSSSSTTTITTPSAVANNNNNAPTTTSASAVAVQMIDHPTLQPTVVEKPVALSTLKPMHSSYLGPIFMDETTFHGSKNPQAQHGAAIESQLRDERIVEIIAPTALVEQTARGTDEARTDVVITTTRPPTVSRVESAHSTPMLSTTVFHVSESVTSTTHLPVKTKQLTPAQQQPAKSEARQTESKISDIQVEVYDSTVDSIVASTNFKDSEGSNYSPPLEAVATAATTKTPAYIATQERFTQYVVDRTDSSTQESKILVPMSLISGKPQPAAIEIHINVSEGVGNQAEDLEFSYRQQDYTGDSMQNREKTSASISLKPFATNAVAQNDSNNPGNSERSDEILVVEIIDTGDNSTEIAASSENVNPIFTFRSDAIAEVELKDTKYSAPHEAIAKMPHMSDELFMADVRREYGKLPRPPPPPPPPPRQSNIDRDSDTIFYISNTEVKVGESLPTANNEFEQQQQQLRKARLESQFFPANYMATSTRSSTAKADEPPHHRYEEDIILSPLRNTADSLKIFRSPADGAPPLDVTYVGESVMEVEQSSGAGSAGLTTTSSSYTASQSADVIIQPAILPEMSIGVPVIGELPPQIELKEIDFMPDEANQQRSGVYENDIEENVNGNDVDRLVESSIQYGGDLIDESAGGGVGFDGVEGSYPFGYPVALRKKAQHDADYAHFLVNHGVSNLRRDELSAEAKGYGEAGNVSGSLENNATLLGTSDGNGTIKNGSETAAPQRMSNATAFSVLEQPIVAEEREDFFGLFSLTIGLIIVILPVVVTLSMACALRYLYSKYHSNNSEDNDDRPDVIHANGTAGDGGERGESSHSPSLTQSDTHQEANYQGDSNEKAREPSNNVSFNIVDESSQSQTTASKLPKDTPRQQPDSVQGHSASTGPNGSVTKMTLKNNHLIVETEERNDISRDARETKMHYTNSDKDGIFVVEVARGIDSKAISESPIIEAPEEEHEQSVREPKQNGNLNIRIENEKLPNIHEEVQVHPPPPEVISSNENPTEELQRCLHQIDEVEEPALSPHSVVDGSAVVENGLTQNSNTGLSQSDLSSSSSTDSNKRYSYGNQELYIIEPAHYENTSSTVHTPLATVTVNESEDDDHKSENGSSLEHSPAQINGKVDCNKLSADDCEDLKVSTNTEEHQLNGYAKEEQNMQMSEESIAEENIEHNKPALVAEEASATNTAVVEKLSSIDANIQLELSYPEAMHETMNGSLIPNEVNGVCQTELEIETENAYDSIMSLPDPPSTEEIKELSDYSLIDANQLDSLPPPPPPPMNDHPEVRRAAVETKIVGHAELGLSKLVNGDTLKSNEFETTSFLSALPPPMEVTGKGKLLPAPLTPPASPPPSPPAHFGNPINGMNGIAGGMCSPMPVAVDVNGS